MIRRMLKKGLPLVEVASSPTSLTDAATQCEQLARVDFPHFALANRFMPADKRPHIWALYAFAKSAQAATATNDDTHLDQLESMLHAIADDETSDAISVALHNATTNTQLALAPLAELINGFRMEQQIQRIATYDALERFIAQVAHPTARAVLSIFGYRDNQLDRYADDFAAALELMQLLKDVFIAARQDRIYLPQEDLQHFGVTEESIKAGLLTPQFKELMRFEVARARALFERGRPLIDRVGPELGFPLAVLYQAGQILLHKLEQRDFDVFRRRPSLSATDVAKMIAKAAAMRWPESQGIVNG